MAMPEIPYILPKLVKGKRLETDAKGVQRAKMEAGQNWYVEFFFYNPKTEKMERFRPTKGLNRIKDPKEKLAAFADLCFAYKTALEGGWNPIDEQENEKLKREIVSLTLNKAKDLFEEYHESKGTRKKSIQSYLSKVNQLITYYGADKRVNEITDFEITQLLNHQEKTEKWLGVTYNNARIALNNFFKYLKKNKYIPVNPVTDTETRTKLATESHQVFSDKDFKEIMKWLTNNDRYTLLFVKAIYYTCIRPKELRYLQLKHINLENNTITVPAHIAKNKKALPINIDKSFRAELDALNIAAFPESDYLFGSTENIIGSVRIGENTPYNRFHTCLEKLKLLNKKYTLYSFKHFSNVKKFKAGWTLAEICAANRHSSLVETETYLKDLLKFVKSDKSIPAI